MSTPVHALETQLIQVSRCSTQVSFLLKCERYSLADYTRSLKEAADKAGMDGWRKHMPGVKTNEQVMTLLFSFPVTAVAAKIPVNVHINSNFRSKENCLLHTMICLWSVTGAGVQAAPENS